MKPSKRATITRMFAFVFSHYRWAIIVVLICVFVASLTSLVSSLFTKTLIDDYIVPLEQTLFKLALILLLGTICSYAYNRLMIHISQGTMLNLRKTIFEKMQRLPVSYFDQRSHGDIMSVYTNDVDSLRQMISTAMAQVFSSVITIVATFTSMIVLSIPLTGDCAEHPSDRSERIDGGGNDGDYHESRKTLAQLLPHTTTASGPCQWFHRGDADRTEGH